jgi:hypothetical membrane protein
MFQLLAYHERVPLIGIWAVIAATLGPIQNIMGWTLSASLWPGYDPIRQTISDLAADDSPVKWVQTSFFIFGATLTLIGAWSAKAFAWPGRVTLFLAGLSSYGVAYFAVPDVRSNTPEHLFFATAAFVLFSAWPLFAMRFDKRYHWSIRPIGAITATAVMSLTTLVFLLTWLDPDRTFTGLAQRTIVVMQVIWLSAAIWMQYLHQRRNALST